MATKRTRSADGATAKRSNSSNRTNKPNNEIERDITPPMPSLNLEQPQRWLDAMDKWFVKTNITDSWVKYSLVATTQAPGGYAVLRADVRDFPLRDPYELARNHILRQNRRPRADRRPYSPVLYSPTNSDDESPVNVNSGAAGGITVSGRSPETTINRAAASTTDDRVTMPSLLQLQEMLMTEIRTIKFDIQEIRALQPNPRRSHRSASRSRPQTNTNVSRDETVRQEECWYHEKYGRLARLCRSPCKHRT